MLSNPKLSTIRHCCHFILEQTAAEEKKLKEEKKRMLLRKLSFRPTVEELKEKKVFTINTFFPFMSIFLFTFTYCLRERKSPANV